MPELPEVETLRRSLETDLVGREIVAVDIKRRDMVTAPGDPSGGFSRSKANARPVAIDPAWLLTGMTIARLTRHGKQMAIEAGTNGDEHAPAVVVQLGMTGSARVFDKTTISSDLPVHTHVVWELDNGRVLAFTDPRRFGGVRLLPEGTQDLWSALGPDALTIRGRVLADRLSSTARPIKAALLDQSVIAGVGNIYADESLFQSGIHPETPAQNVPASTTLVLAKAIREILRSAIKRGGSTVRDYRDASGRSGGYQNLHKVYGRGGQDCTRCGNTLTPIQVAQRATVVCLLCQAPARR